MKFEDMPESMRRLMSAADKKHFGIHDAHNHNAGICPVQPQPVERMPLATARKRKKAGGDDAHARFEITFTVYSMRPCDWDGYDIKHLQDWLVKAGIIPGDGWNTLSGRVYSCKAATEAEEKTVITITGDQFETVTP